MLFYRKGLIFPIYNEILKFKKGKIYDLIGK